MRKTEEASVTQGIQRQHDRKLPGREERTGEKVEEAGGKAQWLTHLLLFGSQAAHDLLELQLQEVQQLPVSLGT